MPPDDSQETWKDDRSQPDTWSADKWWAEMTFRSLPRNLTPSQKRERANRQRWIRRGLSKGTLVERF